MNRGSDRIVCWLAVCCLTLVSLATGLRQIARGQEELPPPLPRAAGAHPRYDLLIDPEQRHGRTIVIVAHVPLVGQVFQNGGGPTCCEEMLQRIGVNQDCDATDEPCAGPFNFHVAGAPPHSKRAFVLGDVILHPGFIDLSEFRGGERRLTISQFEVNGDEKCGDGQCPKLVRLGCPTAGGECTCGNEAGCGNECATVHSPGCKCDDCQCARHVAENHELNCGDENCAARTFVIHHAEAHDPFADFHPLKLMQHIAGLMAEKAAAQAALEVRQEAAGELAELYESMAELIADNAALDAKVQAYDENKKLLERIADLAVDNARLKAHAELADERIELAKTAAALTFENERLKLRLAELESHAASDAARTASTPHGTTK